MYSPAYTGLAWPWCGTHVRVVGDTRPLQRNIRRRALFDAQDEIDAQRERLIAEIEGKLQQMTSLTELFAIRWSLT
jgi:hypothetical protein